MSYISKLGLIAEIKWLPELDVTNRTKGDYVWFTLAQMGYQGNAQFELPPTYTYISLKSNFTA